MFPNKHNQFIISSLNRKTAINDPQNCDRPETMGGLEGLHLGGRATKQVQKHLTKPTSRRYADKNHADSSMEIYFNLLV